MAMIPLHSDFSAFLKLLNENEVRYLVIGGYAVGYHGYVRSTAVLDIWVPQELSNSDKLVSVLKEFGFDVPGLTANLFLDPRKIIRMGIAPMQIEITTSILGVDFEECYSERVQSSWDDIEISMISLRHLRKSKKASGRLRDLDDLEHLPDADP